jgi:chromosome segregation ATPase
MLRDREAENARLASKCGELEVQLASARQTSSAAPAPSEEASAAMMRELEEVKSKLDHEQRKAENLGRELEEAKMKASTAANASQPPVDKIAQLEAQVAESQKRYTDVQQLFESACAERDAATSKLLTTQNAEIFAKDEALRKASDVKRLEGEIVDLKSQLSKGQESANRLIEVEARATAREQEVARLKEEAKAQTLEVSRLAGQIKAMQEVHRSQLEEMKALAADARLCVIEREAKEDLQGKLNEARTRIVQLEEQVEQLHVLRSTDASRANEAASESVQDRLLAKDAEVKRLELELEQVRGDLEASRTERDTMVVKQTQALQDEMLRVNTSLTASQQQVADLQEQLRQLKASKQQGVPDAAVIEEYKNSLALKESEIEALRRQRDQELLQATAFAKDAEKELEGLRKRLAAEEGNVAKLKDELALSREENDNLKRKASALSKMEADLHLERTASANTETELVQV